MTCAMKKFHLKVKGATVSNPFTSTGGHEVPVLDRTLEFWRKKLQRFRTMLFSQTILFLSIVPDCCFCSVWRIE